MSIKNFIVLFLVILGGSIAHIAVDMLKETRSNETNQIKAISEILLWINIKEFKILKGIFFISFSFLILIMLYPTIDCFTIFIAGYSIDSLGDLFIGKFDTTMGLKAEELKKTIS